MGSIADVIQELDKRRSTLNPGQVEILDELKRRQLPFGTERTGLPRAGKPPLPRALDPNYQQPYSFINPPEGMIRTGLREAVYGTAQGDPKRVLGGIARAAEPAFIGAGLGSFAAAPLATLTNTALGVVSGYLGKEGAKKLGAGETVQDLVGLVSGMIGMGMGPKEETIREVLRYRNNPEVRAALGKLASGFKSKFPLSTERQEAVAGLRKALKTAK